MDEGHGMGDELLLKHSLLSEVECGEVKDGKGYRISMKGFAIKASMLEIVSQGEGWKKTVGIKVFLAGGSSETIGTSFFFQPFCRSKQLYCLNPYGHSTLSYHIAN